MLHIFYDLNLINLLFTFSLFFGKRILSFSTNLIKHIVVLTIRLNLNEANYYLTINSIDLLECLMNVKNFYLVFQARIVPYLIQKLENPFFMKVFLKISLVFSNLNLISNNYLHIYKF
jgi:hypothetical protein